MIALDIYINIFTIVFYMYIFILHFYDQFRLTFLTFLVAANAIESIGFGDKNVADAGIK